MTRLIATPSRTKEILEQYGLRAKKGFGQNFLVDPVITDRVASLAHCQDSVIEIGPGIGSLTEALALHSRHVTSYEVDSDLIPVLKDTLSAYGNVEILLQDFLECDLDAKVEELVSTYGSTSVCANLPYYITTPVLFRLFENASIPWITVMVQKEVGDRFAAKPGSSEYSALSVEGQYLYSIKKLFNVPGRSFNPSPAVDSVILQFERKDVPASKEEIHVFFELARACFKQRRKTVYNNLKEYTGEADRAGAILEKAGIPAGRRAQELSVDEILKIHEAMK